MLSLSLTLLPALIYLCDVKIYGLKFIFKFILNFILKFILNLYLNLYLNLNIYIIN